MPKFGEWDVNDPASAEGFTVIFNKARDEKKTGGQPESPTKTDAHTKHAADQSKPPAVSCFLISQLYEVLCCNRIMDKSFRSIFCFFS